MPPAPSSPAEHKLLVDVFLSLLGHEDIHTLAIALFSAWATLRTEAAAEPMPLSYEAVPTLLRHTEVEHALGKLVQATRPWVAARGGEAPGPHPQEAAGQDTSPVVHTLVTLLVEQAGLVEVLDALLTMGEEDWQPDPELGTHPARQYLKAARQSALARSRASKA